MPKLHRVDFCAKFLMFMKLLLIKEKEIVSKWYFYYVFCIILWFLTFGYHFLPDVLFIFSFNYIYIYIKGFNVIYIFTWLHTSEKYYFIYYLITMIRKYCRIKESNTKLMKHVESSHLINIRYIRYYFKKKNIGDHKTTFKFLVTTYFIVIYF